VFKKTILLLLSVGIIGVLSLRFIPHPYDKSANTQSGFIIEQVILERDHSYYWINVTLKFLNENFKTPERIVLITDKNKIIPSADSTSSNDKNSLLVRFWVEAEDARLSSRISMPSGEIQLKNQGLSELKNTGRKKIHSLNW
jgi:hypothetical protein